jgi:outer membrane protein assembly factor BamB
VFCAPSKIVLENVWRHMDAERRRSRASMRVRHILAIMCLSCLAPSLLAHDWPHWRGPQSNGVGVVSHTPERWSPTESVLWRAEIEGYGISSPVIVGNRAYLTTAITGQLRTAPRLACDVLIGCLAVLGVPILVRYRLKLRTTKASEDRLSLMYRAAQALDLAMFILLAIAVLVFGTLMAIGPKAVDVGLNGVRDVGVQLARLLGRHQTNLWFLEWDEGTRHTTWIISSGMTLASLALTPFLFPANSPVRLVGAAALLIGVALATVYVPWGVAYGSRYPTSALFVLYSPVVALASWHLFESLLSRIGGAAEVRAATTQGSRLVGSVPALLSFGLFVSPNYLQHNEMLTRRLVCLDTATGVRLWQTDVFTTAAERKSSLNSHATPTPSVVEDGIVAAFGPGIAVFNLNGRLLWSRTFPHWIENSIYGAGSSPVTDGEAVFVTNDREYEARRHSRVIAYSLKTGNELWSNTPQFARDGYSTPVIYYDGSRKLLLALTSGNLVAYDTASGVMAWRLKISVSQAVPSPIVEGGRLYVTGGSGYTAAYQLRHNTAPAELWMSSQSPADVSSPVLYRGRLFTISSTGIMVCYDAGTGKIVWRQRVGSGLGVFYASLVAADDKVYAVRSNGTTYVIAVEDKFRLISESSLAEEIFASPAFAADCFFVRTVSALYCIRNKG